MQDDLPIYPIRTVASLTGVDARRLRSWESEYHLLEPARSKGGHRLYSPRDLRLVHLIRRLVDQEGMSLQGIKAYLAAQPELPGPAAGPSERPRGDAGEGGASRRPVPEGGDAAGGMAAAAPAPAAVAVRAAAHSGHNGRGERA
jgi:DNA-binding transcriptional MerR regulator